MRDTKIEWCSHTFNPWIGCSKVHLGCTNCYAEADMDKRRGRVAWGPDGTRSLTKTWGDPVRWNRAAEKKERPRVFCASLADVFEDYRGPIVDHHGGMMCRCATCGTQPFGGDALPPHCGKCKGHADPLTMDDLRADLFRLIDATPHLDWLLLTKRPENVRRMWPSYENPVGSGNRDYHRGEAGGLQLPNVWLGTSVSDQETADKQIPELLKCRDLAQRLFVSAEPLLGPVDFGCWVPSADGFVAPFGGGAWHVDDGGPQLDWIIFGGESGPNARPCNVKWIRSGVEQCRAAGVACFVKQLGKSPMVLQHPFGPCELQLKDPKGGDPDEWPEDLRVREVPAA